MASESGQPFLLVVRGAHVGSRFPLGPGEQSIGRDPDADIPLEDAGVSRRHALLTSSQGAISIRDWNSTIGTAVNGERLFEARTLRPGDEVAIGAATLTLQTGDAEPAAQQAGPPSRRRVSVGRLVLIGGLVNLAILVAGVAIQLVTDFTGLGAWLAAPLTGMVAALVEAGREALTREPQPTPDAPGSPRTTPRPSSRRRVSLTTALVVVLVIGAGGALATYGVATVSGYVTGNQAGEPRLQNGPVSVESSGVVTTVDTVEQTADFTRIELVVQNNLTNTITLPLFGNATLAADGNTLDADNFRSSWSETIGPGQLRKGTIIFVGHLAESATTASFAFATVFEQGFEGPRSILVPDLQLAPSG